MEIIKQNAMYIIALFSGIIITLLIFGLNSILKWSKRKYRDKQFEKQIEKHKNELKSLKSHLNNKNSEYEELQNKIDFWTNQKDSIIKERDNAFEEKQEFERKKHDLLIEIKKLQARIDTLAKENTELLSQKTELIKNKRKYEIEINELKNEFNRFSGIFNEIKTLFNVGHGKRFWLIISILVSLIYLVIPLVLILFVKSRSIVTFPFLTYNMLIFGGILTVFIWFAYLGYHKTAKATKKIIPTFDSVFRPEILKKKLENDIAKLYKNKNNLEDKIENILREIDQKTIEYNRIKGQLKAEIDGLEEARKAKADAEKNFQFLAEINAETKEANIKLNTLKKELNILNKEIIEKGKEREILNEEIEEIENQIKQFVKNIQFIWPNIEFSHRAIKDIVHYSQKPSDHLPKLYHVLSLLESECGELGRIYGRIKEIKKFESIENVWELKFPPSRLYIRKTDSKTIVEYVVLHKTDETDNAVRYYFKNQ